MGNAGGKSVMVKATVDTERQIQLIRMFQQALPLALMSIVRAPTFLLRYACHLVHQEA